VAWKLWCRWRRRGCVTDWAVGAAEENGMGERRREGVW
jgi:hypothetical protein